VADRALSAQNSEVDLDVSVGGEARFFARSTPASTWVIGSGRQEL
jgi:hypothetical protein